MRCMPMLHKMHRLCVWDWRATCDKSDRLPTSWDADSQTQGTLQLALLRGEGLLGCAAG